jgi:hypothetical protein
MLWNRRYRFGQLLCERRSAAEEQGRRQKQSGNGKSHVVAPWSDMLGILILIFHLFRRDFILVLFLFLFLRAEKHQ